MTTYRITGASDLAVGDVVRTPAQEVWVIDSLAALPSLWVADLLVGYTVMESPKAHNLGVKSDMEVFADTLFAVLG
jgi:hypothetical protein